jgi:hypothetical protein
MKRAIIAALALVVVMAAADLSPAIERHAYVIGSRVQMHESAGGDSPIVALLSEGVAVDIVGRTAKPANVEGFTDYWYRIVYRGKAGWVFGQFVLPSTGGRGLSGIYTAAELIDYCDRATRNLVNIKKAGFAGALMEDSSRFLEDIKEMSGDSVLSAYEKELSSYRLFAALSLAEGYAGTGDMKGAEKIRKELSAADPGAKLPDGTMLGDRLRDLDGLIKTKGGAAE